MGRTHAPPRATLPVGRPRRDPLPRPLLLPGPDAGDRRPGGGLDSAGDGAGVRGTARTPSPPRVLPTMSLVSIASMFRPSALAGSSPGSGRATPRPGSPRPAGSSSIPPEPAGPGPFRGSRAGRRGSAGRWSRASRWDGLRDPSALGDRTSRIPAGIGRRRPGRRLALRPVPVSPIMRPASRPFSSQASGSR